MTVTLGHVENPSAKVQWIKVPQTAPGHCSICGNGQDSNGFADTGLDFEFWGRVIFCRQCVTEIAAVFGFIAPEDYEELEGERNLAMLRQEKAEYKNEEFERIVEGIANLRALIPSVSSGTAADLETPNQESESSNGINEIDDETIRSVDESSSKNDGQQRKTTEPTNSKGFLNI